MAKISINYGMARKFTDAVIKIAGNEYSLRLNAAGMIITSTEVSTEDQDVYLVEQQMEIHPISSNSIRIQARRKFGEK